jgi:hypothetical protein
MPDFDKRNAPGNEEAERLNLDEQTRGRERDRGVSDTGHTAGGGSLGHDQPDKVRRETPTRNAVGNATGSDSDPVMPSDDATLKTKI